MRELTLLMKQSLTEITRLVILGRLHELDVAKQARKTLGLSAHTSSTTESNEDMNRHHRHHHVQQ